MKNERRIYKVRPILVLNPINFWGRLAVKLIKFSGWFYEITGNKWSEQKRRKNEK